MPELVSNPEALGAPGRARNEGLRNVLGAFTKFMEDKKKQDALDQAADIISSLTGGSEDELEAGSVLEEPALEEASDPSTPSNFDPSQAGVAASAANAGGSGPVQKPPVEGAAAGVIAPGGDPQAAPQQAPQKQDTGQITPEQAMIEIMALPDMSAQDKLMFQNQISQFKNTQQLQKIAPVLAENLGIKEEDILAGGPENIGLLTQAVRIAEARAGREQPTLLKVESGGKPVVLQMDRDAEGNFTAKKVFEGALSPQQQGNVVGIRMGADGKIESIVTGPGAAVAKVEGEAQARLVAKKRSDLEKLAGDSAVAIAGMADVIRELDSGATVQGTIGAGLQKIASAKSQIENLGVKFGDFDPEATIKKLAGEGKLGKLGELVTKSATIRGNLINSAFVVGHIQDPGNKTISEIKFKLALESIGGSTGDTQQMRAFMGATANRLVETFQIRARGLEGSNLDRIQELLPEGDFDLLFPSETGTTEEDAVATEFVVDAEGNVIE